MAAPGLGIGDLVSACQFIYDMCMKYNDAPKEFDEIAEKSKSTAVVLERIDIEARMKGNLVDRAGRQGYTQLEDHLKGLRRDSEKLKSLVTKYGKIHDEGAGRRLLFTIKESGGLTDLRRRIGLHEQMLQIWYMTLVYGSLRRLEGGQEDILKAIEAIKNWSPRKVHEVRKSLRKGDSKPLERELCKSGLEPQSVDAALGTAVDYVDAPPLEKVRMESHARSSSTMHREASGFRPTSHPFHPDFPFEKPFGYEYPPFPPESYMHRREASSHERPPRFSSRTDDYDAGDARKERLPRDKNRHGEEDVLKKERPKASKPSKKDNLTADHGRPRSSSQTTKPTPPSPLLLVPNTAPRQRPASYHDPGDRHERRHSDAGSRDIQYQYITIPRTPQRHRSLSRELHPVDKDRRDHSSHSHT